MEIQFELTQYTDERTSKEMVVVEFTYNGTTYGRRFEYTAVMQADKAVLLAEVEQITTDIITDAKDREAKTAAIKTFIGISSVTVNI